MVMRDAIKSTVETMFRFFPFPTSTGLRVVGRPGRDAPVLLTCNFDLTVRRVLRALEGLNCYLLVAPSRGINVWCASGGGILNAHAVISVLKTSGIAEKVDHRTLVLPQLSGPGIDAGRVEAETGWSCRFGPVYAEDVPAYVAAGLQKTAEMRRVRFPLGERLQMAVMWAAPMSLLVGIPLAIFRPHLLPGVLALIWAFSLFLYAFYRPVKRLVPGPVGTVRVLLLGLLGVAGLAAWSLALGHWPAGRLVGWSLGILGVALVLGFDLEGTSPLEAGATVGFWAARWPGVLKVWALVGYELERPFSLRVDVERCRGCRTCVEVCPKGVYEMVLQDGSRKSRVAHPAGCVQCTACVKQCPKEAIVADPPIRVFAEV
ncbi:MAG: 4Fe-4S dicluster domain-containing protein [Anaerolineae bacterium]|nr:4Fe-4S dicluster domain-containing protein [Anaerolineae bacterium]